MSETDQTGTPSGVLFKLEEVSYTPEFPRRDEAFVVKGKIKLFGIPFLGPLWVTAFVDYPENWWEEIIPLLGSPTVARSDVAGGGNFTINFPEGFKREGDYPLRVALYAGPTSQIRVGQAGVTMPPFPSVANYDAVFTVAGEPPSQTINFTVGNATASPTTVAPGSHVTLYAQVTNLSPDTLQASVRFDIHNTGFLFVSGSQVGTVQSASFSMAPGETRKFSADYLATDTGSKYRDVWARVICQGQDVAHASKDNVFKVESGGTPEPVPGPGFVIGLYSPDYPGNTRFWSGNFNSGRHTMSFKPYTTPWVDKTDLGTNGETGTLKIDLYDDKQQLVKTASLTTTLRNNHVYWYHANQNRLDDMGTGPF